jgi:hypothetical protein
VKAVLLQSIDSSNVQLVLDVSQSLGRLVQLLPLFVSQGAVHHAQDPRAADLGRQAQEHLVFQAVEALRAHRHRVDPPLVTQHALHQARHRVPDRPRRVALQLDHLIGTIHHQSANRNMSDHSNMITS